MTAGGRRKPRTSAPHGNHPDADLDVERVDAFVHGANNDALADAHEAAGLRLELDDAAGDVTVLREQACHTAVGTGRPTRVDPGSSRADSSISRTLMVYTLPSRHATQMRYSTSNVPVMAMNTGTDGS